MNACLVQRDGAEHFVRVSDPSRHGGEYIAVIEFLGRWYRRTSARTKGGWPVFRENAR